MAEKNEIIEHIIESGVDFKRRRIYFGALPESSDEYGSDFTWRSVERAIRQIHIMEAEAPQKPIELHISSGGGDPHAMLRLHDVIQASSCQFKCFGGGDIASAAVWILACCDERYLYPNTRILIHDSSAYELGEEPAKLIDAAIALDEEKLLQAKLNQIFADNSRMPLEFWEEMVKRDLWISAEETIMLGLADKIIPPVKRGNLRRVRMALLKRDVDRKDMNKFMRLLKDRIYMDKLSKLEFHVPVEGFDSNIVVDNSPVEEPKTTSDHTDQKSEEQKSTVS